MRCYARFSLPSDLASRGRSGRWRGKHKHAHATSTELYTHKHTSAHSRLNVRMNTTLGAWLQLSTGSPFVGPRSPLGHYHPSPGKTLTQRARHTSLSPVRLQSLSPKAGFNASGSQAQKPGARQDKRQNERVEAQVAVRTANSQPDPDSSDPFDESWPSTEQSSARTPEAVEREAGQEPVPPTREPVIARFVERFRHGRPTSRAEREAAERAGRGSFWWLQDPATKATARAVDHLDSGRSQPRSPRRSSSERSLGQRSSGKSGPSPACSSLEGMRQCNNSDTEGDGDLSVNGLMDADTRSLQERASQLLERSESTLSSRAGAVSSAGLGSARSSERNFTEPARPPWGHLELLLPGSTTPLVSSQPTLTTPLPPGAGRGTTPADDILYQWRLRRRMEEAREFGTKAAHDARAVPSSDRELPRPTAWQLPQANAGVLFTAEDTGRHPPNAPARYEVPIASPHIRLAPTSDTLGGPKDSMVITPHLHLSCDVLPCPHHPLVHHEIQDEHRPLRPVRVAPHGSNGGKEESRGEIGPRSLTRATERSGTTGRPKTSKIASRPSKTKVAHGDDDRERRGGDGDRRHGASGLDVTSDRQSGSRTEPAEKSSSPPASSADRGSPERAAKPGRERHERRPSGEDAGAVERKEVRPERARNGKKRRDGGGGAEHGSARSDESPLSSAVGLPRPGRDKGRAPRPHSPSSAQPGLPSAVLCLLEQAEDSDGVDFPDDPLLKLLREQRNRVRDRLCDTTRLISSLELTAHPS
ncbi:proline and serine-rich protein 3 isoform X2 [Petromyzon marinus]|uniref:proline and serine-rich protein 3 isoform X2 n=1 Tax=Petromyzon marinus TaxID=7757 RepID=UPI003F7170F8